MTPFLHPKLQLQVIFKITKFLKTSIPGTVRIHSTIASQYPCSRLWYFLRGLDIQGSGAVTLELSITASIFLGVSQSTIYQWLREGKKLGFFRAYRKNRKSGLTKIYLGGLHSLCLQLGLTNWGKVGTIPISEALSFFSLRCHAAEITTSALQHGSRFAAKSKLKRGSGRRVLHPHEIFNQENTTCQKSGKRVKVPYLVHVSKRIAFVRQSFVPFGTSQESVGEVLGRSSRSVRRYLDYIKVPRRQICQRDSNLTPVLNLLKFSDSESLRLGEQVLYEENRSGKSNKFYVGSDRLFRYWGHTWLRRCNIYDLHCSLNTMKAARNKLEKLIKLQSRRAGTAPRSCSRSGINETYNLVNNCKNSEEIPAIASAPQEPG